MIYEINKKYYVKVGSLYNEISIELQDDEVVLKPLKNKLEVTEETVKTINFQSEKENFKKKLLKKNNKEELEVSKESPKYEKYSRYNRH